MVQPGAHAGTRPDWNMQLTAREKARRVRRAPQCMAPQKHRGQGQANGRVHTVLIRLRQTYGSCPMEGPLKRRLEGANSRQPYLTARVLSDTEFGW
jgi:hypothetical protein